MYLSQRNAERIVNEISTVIGRKINMMDEDGIIIASSDKERIGEIHEGARIVIENRLDELLINDFSQYNGCREGVNYPIIIRNETIGVIGITGKVDEVAKYGQITKKMTEILLKEISVKEQKILDEQATNRYLSEWLMNENVLLNKNFVERGRHLGVDITIPRRILVIATYFDESSSKYSELDANSLEKEEIKIKNMLLRNDPECLFMKSGSNLVCGISNRKEKELRFLAEMIINLPDEKSGVRIAVGIDDQTRPYTQMHISYIRAAKALHSCVRMHKYNIRFYNEITMEIFMDEISDSTKKEYVTKLFKGYSVEELLEAVEILEVLYEMEGSIGAASERLHMHKNTLQYKLKKISERTGYDPRSVRFSTLFMVAVNFYWEINEQLNEQFAFSEKKLYKIHKNEMQ